MRTDPILEELYQIRAELMRKAGSADVFFCQTFGTSSAKRTSTAAGAVARFVCTAQARCTKT
jgi:hypothetical protein